MNVCIYVQCVYIFAYYFIGFGPCNELTLYSIFILLVLSHFFFSFRYSFVVAKSPFNKHMLFQPVALPNKLIALF